MQDLHGEEIPLWHIARFFWWRFTSFYIHSIASAQSGFVRFFFFWYSRHDDMTRAGGTLLGASRFFFFFSKLLGKQIDTIGSMT